MQNDQQNGEENFNSHDRHRSNGHYDQYDDRNKYASSEHSDEGGYCHECSDGDGDILCIRIASIEPVLSHLSSIAVCAERGAAMDLIGARRFMLRIAIDKSG